MLRTAPEGLLPGLEGFTVVSSDQAQRPTVGPAAPCGRNIVIGVRVRNGCCEPLLGV